MSYFIILNICSRGHKHLLILILPENAEMSGCSRGEVKRRCFKGALLRRQTLVSGTISLPWRAVVTTEMKQRPKVPKKMNPGAKNVISFSQNPSVVNFPQVG